MNPGVGLWSRKLHDFLQPRSHLLVDSAPEFYGQWLKPLLDAPGSTYKLVQGDIAKLDTLERLVADGMFPHQKRVQPGEAGSQRPNDSLLVTGTLIWDPKLPGFGFDSMSKQLLLQFAEAAWKNRIYHSFGPARSLFWVAGDAKNIIPRSEFHHAKYDFYLDMLATNTEVVTQRHIPRSSGRDTVGREPQHEIQSLVGAMRRGREKGMHLPAHRREDLHEFADEIVTMTEGSGAMPAVNLQEYLREKVRQGKSTVGLLPDRTIEYYQIEKQLEENPDLAIDLSKPGRPGRPASSALKKRLSIVRASVNQAHALRLRCEEVADLGIEIYKLECRILGMTDGPEKEQETARLQQLDEEYATKFGSMYVNYMATTLSAIDDRLSICSPVPRLAWDFRPYEPLVARPEEVWPANDVCLIDSTPRPLPPGKDLQYYDWMQDFLTALMEQPSMSVHKALEDLQHGASEIIAKAPSLKDPKRGGRLSMHHLRVRMLTVEMVAELCQAYREWPFRHPEANHTRYFRVKGNHGSQIY